MKASLEIMMTPHRHAGEGGRLPMSIRGRVKEGGRLSTKGWVWTGVQLRGRFRSSGIDSSIVWGEGGGAGGRTSDQAGMVPRPSLMDFLGASRSHFGSLWNTFFGEKGTHSALSLPASGCPQLQCDTALKAHLATDTSPRGTMLFLE